MLVSRVQFLHSLSIVLFEEHQLYIEKREFCPFLHQFAPKMRKSWIVQTGRSLGQNSTWSCLNTCLWLLSHNRQALTRTIQNSLIERNFGVLVDSSKISCHYWQKSNKFFIVYLFIIIQIWLKSQISLCAFPASVLQCQQPKCQPIFVRNHSINGKSNRSLCFFASLNIFLTIKAKVLVTAPAPGHKQGSSNQHLFS